MYRTLSVFFITVFAVYVTEAGSVLTYYSIIAVNIHIVIDKPQS